MPVSGQDAVPYFRDSWYHFMAVESEHAATVEDLAAYHQDPFDRILVAQAIIEPMRLITHDAKNSSPDTVTRSLRFDYQPTM